MESRRYESAKHPPVCNLPYHQHAFPSPLISPQGFPTTVPTVYKLVVESTCLGLSCLHRPKLDRLTILSRSLWYTIFYTMGRV